MAEQQQQQPNVLAAAFPSPPPFYEHFTPENLERISTLRATQQASSSNTPQQTPESKLPIRLLDLPPELRFLQPPEPPAEGRYRSFGDNYNLNEVLPSLKEQGIEQLYTPPDTPGSSSNDSAGAHTDRALILKLIAKSLLLNFLELMGIMSVNPEQYSDKIQDLRTLFINFHHLLNEYRPHQARESLILMMEAQLARAKAETEGIEKMKAKVEGILAGLGQAKLVSGDEMEREMKSTVEGDDDRYEREVWDELEKEFG